MDEEALRLRLPSADMAAQPSGTVTLLFSDVEGSTRLLHSVGRELYAELLATQRSLLRDACRRHDGYEVDAEGDGLFVAFRTAAAAVASAGEAQRALGEHRWPEEQALRVRMGIHTGEPLVAAPKYVGLAVHRAARIMSAAHGGQVLVSDSTERLLAGDERALSSFSLVDLGLWRLKDFDRPVRLYQLAGDGLEKDFPRVRAERVAPPRRRRRLAVAVAALAIVVLAVGIALLTRGGSAQAAPANSVAVLDSTRNALRGVVAAGMQPGAIAATHGSVLAANTADETLTDIDPTTQQVDRTIPLGEITDDIAAAGSVWALEYGHPLRVALMDFNAARPSKTATYHQECGGCSPIIKQGMAATDQELIAGGVAFAHGSVWAAGTVPTTPNPGTVLMRVDPSTGRIASTLNFEASTASGVAVGNGSIWVAAAGDDAVWQVDEGTDQVDGKVTVGKEPSDVAFGDGSVWVTTAGDDSLWRLDAPEGGNVTVRSVIHVGSRPSSVAVTPDAVWVANHGDGTVSRADPRTNKVVATIHVGNAPTGIAVSGGHVWTTVQGAQQ